MVMLASQMVASKDLRLFRINSLHCCCVAFFFMADISWL